MDVTPTTHSGNCNIFGPKDHTTKTFWAKEHWGYLNGEESCD